MKKTILSLALIFSFAGYAFYNRANGTNTDVPIALAPEPNNPDQPSVVSSAFTDTFTPTITFSPASTPTPQPKPQVVKKPTPKPTPVQKPKPVVINTGKYKNGSYTGPSVDAYYGNVQVQVTISGGKISDVQFLDYPQDRNTSVRINTRAIPRLISEAITAQDANVDGVSGASATSAAYKQSLAGALAQAKA